MPVASTQSQVRGWAFFPVVSSSIATAGGLLILVMSFVTDTSGGAPTSGAVFGGVRRIAAGLINIGRLHSAR